MDRTSTYDFNGIKSINRQKDYRYKHYLKTKRIPACRYRAIFEQHLGRKLWPKMVIHHIDCNPGNNDINNLVACTNQRHRLFHNELEYLARNLIEAGIIKFDKFKFEYYFDEGCFEVKK